jgi:tetratricopeptide (TPR) repeat protein
VAAGASVILILIAGIFFTTRAWNAEAVERRRAEASELAALAAQQQAEKARGDVWDLSLRLVTDFPQKFIPLAGTIAVRQAMAEAAIPYLEELAAAAPTDPTRRLGVAQALDQLARSKADPRSGNIGDIPGALPLQSRVLAIRREVLSQDPQNAGYQLLVADSAIRLADLRRYSGDCKLAISQYEEAIRILTPLIDGARSAEARPRLAGALAAKGECLLSEGDLARAREMYERAQDVRRRQAAEVKDDASRRNLSVGQLDLANVLLLQGQRPEAIDLMHQAVAIRRELLQAQPTQARTRRDLARALIDLAQAEHADGQSNAATRSAKEALAILDPLIEAELDYPDVRHRQAWCRGALVLLQADAAMTSEERSKLLDRSLASASALVRDAPEVAENGRLQARALLMSGASELESNHLEEALATLSDAARATDSLVGLIDASIADHILQGDIRALMGRIHELRSQDEEIDAASRDQARESAIAEYESSLRAYSAADGSAAATSESEAVRAALARLNSLRR